VTVVRKAQKRTGTGRERGHTFNLTAEQVEASEEVVAGTILVQSFSVISLFNFETSHCYISTRFVKMHSIHYDDIDTQWEISTWNEIMTTNRVCKSYPLDVCGRKLSADIFVIDTSGYDVILGMTWLSNYHAMICCQSKSMIFRIPHQPEFQFIGESRHPISNNKGIMPHRSSGGADTNSGRIPCCVPRRFTRTSARSRRGVCHRCYSEYGPNL